MQLITPEILKPPIGLEAQPPANFVPIKKRMPIWGWIKQCEIKVKGCIPYTTKGCEYLDQIILDDDPDQTWEKAAQVKISTWVLAKSLYVCEHLGLKALYFFQDDAAVSDFSNDRCLGMLQGSPYLMKQVRDINNVGLKRIGNGSLYFRGLFTKGKAKSVDGDFVIFDEVSEMNEKHRQLAKDRVMASNLQWIHALSQPDLPGHDIDFEFQSTDQHYWHLVCPSCGYKDNVLEMDFVAGKNFLPVPEKLRAGSSFPEGATHYRGCSKCGARLDPAKGIWVAHQPSRNRRGYHLSQLYTSIKPPKFANYASHIMNEYAESKRSQDRLSRFFISILGYPYAGGAARVTDDLLNSCEGPESEHYPWSYQEVGAFMGVDQGDNLTVSIGIRGGLNFYFSYFEETRDWDRLDALMAQFGVHYCVCDAQPNKYPAKEFAARWPGRVSIQYFAGKDLKMGEEPHKDEKTMIPYVTVDRTESIDNFIDKMEAGLIRYPARRLCESLPLSRLEDVRRHLKELIVRYDTDKSGRTQKTYARGPNIENHYGMSCNSATLAAYTFGSQAATTVLPVFRRINNTA